MMDNLPKQANEAVTEHINLLESLIPEFVDSYYIYGSVSLGAFSYGLSDVDFIVVAKRKITTSDLELLKRIHTTIKKIFLKTDLMGLYITKDDLQAEHENQKNCPCFIDGIFKGYRRFDRDSIDAFQLQKYGITIKGENIDLVNFPINWNKLLNNMRNNLNTYWVNWKNACLKFPSVKYISLFISLKSIEWGVLGVTRLFYTFKERDITSKVGAGEYALRTVPQRWRKIINEAMRLRKGIKKSDYHSIFDRRNDTVSYMEYIINESNSLQF